jgi:UPF0755 protein
VKTAGYFLGLFLIAFSVTYGILSLGSVEQSSVEIPFTIASGESVRDVTNRLGDEGILWFPLFFRWHLSRHGLDTKLQPGTYQIARDAGYEAIAQMITATGSREATVTIPEGYTIVQIDALLASMNLIEQGEFADCTRECDFSSFTFIPGSGELEGYLFPDTYFVTSENFSVQKFTERLLRTFQERVVEGSAEGVQNSGRSLHDIVTMASLIERETRRDDERPIISGILWKRYDNDWGLDVDATVRYAVGKMTEPLTRDDLNIDSPYNTRRFAGLPPGPIANPGMRSIRAAIEPEISPYWYYLHGTDGSIHYSETNEEHNTKKARYL